MFSCWSGWICVQELQLCLPLLDLWRGDLKGLHAACLLVLIFLHQCVPVKQRHLLGDMERLAQVMQVLEAIHRSFLLPGIVLAGFPYIWSHLREEMVNLRSFIGHQPGRRRLLRFLGLLLRLLELMQIGRLCEQRNGVDGQFDVLEARWPLILLQKILLPNACFDFGKGWRKLRISARVRWTVRHSISFLLKRIEVRDRLIECILVLHLVR